MACGCEKKQYWRPCDIAGQQRLAGTYPTAKTCQGPDMKRGEDKLPVSGSCNYCKAKKAARKAAEKEAKKEAARSRGNSFLDKLRGR